MTQVKTRDWHKGDIFRLRVTNHDKYHAVCGNGNTCVAGQAIQRQLGGLCTSKNVGYNKVNLVHDGIAYRFAVPDGLLKLQRLDDKGELSLGPDHKFDLICLSARPVRVSNLTEEEREANRVAQAKKRVARAAAGKPKDSAYSLRRQAAIRAGKQAKRALRAA